MILLRSSELKLNRRRKRENVQGKDGDESIGDFGAVSGGVAAVFLSYSQRVGAE